MNPSSETRTMLWRVQHAKSLPARRKNRPPFRAAATHGLGALYAALAMSCARVADEPGTAGNRPPVVSAIQVTPSSQVLPGDHIELSATATDPDGDTILVQWSAEEGTFDEPAALQTGYTVPDHLGPLALSLDLDDTQGNHTQFSVSIVVGYQLKPDQDGDGLTWEEGDCNDLDPAVSPRSPEVPDGIDNDCDGLVDEASAASDDDGDGQSELSGDCNDDDPTIFRGAPEGTDTNGDGILEGDGVDNDCDGLVDENTDISDDDGDGFTELDGDCLDTTAAAHPGATEIADGIDNDCDGAVDESTVFNDDDHDGFSEVDGDCDDTDPDTYPDAPERLDGTDNDCDGLTDEGAPGIDDDGDGFTDQAGDCNDADPSIFPGAEEIADGVDNDCDGEIDESTVENDDDGDGFAEIDGDCDDTSPAVYPGADEVVDGLDNDCNGLVDDRTVLSDDDHDGFSENQGDCDDQNALVSPDHPEYADGVDNDCDGTIDEGTEAYDDDGDGMTELEGDCDDTRADVYPGATEWDDGVDNDCDGLGDPNTPPTAIIVSDDPETVCQDVLLDGTSSFDSDGDELVQFRWYVVAKPQESMADDTWILDPHAAWTFYVTDVPGTYTVGLLVSDGNTTSDAATTTFEVVDRDANRDPTADAGDDQTMAASVHCAYSGDAWYCPPCDDLTVTIDASNSVDPDGDRLFFTWTISSTTAPSATIADPTTPVTALTLPAPPAEHGRTNTYAVLLKLEVHDCQNERDVDSVVITYACTGL